MDGKGAGVPQPAGWSSPFAGLCCEKSSFCLAQPLGGCPELVLGRWVSNLIVADVCFMGESLCRVPEQGQDCHRGPTGATATRALSRVGRKEAALYSWLPLPCWVSSGSDV